MTPLWETVTELTSQAEILRCRTYGVIEAADGRFRRVVLRPWPKIVSAPGILLAGALRNRMPGGDRCRIYYNQPRRCPNYLAVPYVVTARGTGLATVRRALEVLDYIAELKRSDALLCDVANWRISPRLLAREGWEPHAPARWHRHYIKRFYGTYPARPEWM